MRQAEILLVRHGATAGNLERRYIGTTDQPLCPEGSAQVLALGKWLRSQGLGAPDALYTSPLLRARQTAELLFPGMTYTVCPDLRETDFGIFEGKTAEELWEGDPRYRDWVEAGCTGAIPGGERVEDSKRRCVLAFRAAVQALQPEGWGAFVFHGGGIMAVMEALAEPRQAFYAWRLPNAGAYRCGWTGEKLTVFGAWGASPE